MFAHTKKAEPEKETRTPQEPSRGHVQDMIPIKRIYRGMIITTDDRYVRILEFTPINFSLRSVEEQNNIIYLFSSWLRIAPVKLQFKVITRSAETSTIVNNILASSRNETNEECRKLIQDHVEFIRQLAGKEALTRRYFVAFEYEPPSNRQRTLDEIADELNRTAYRIKAGLARCGNEMIEPSQLENLDYAQAEILYTFFNRRSCATEEFADRVTRVTSDTMKLMGLQDGVDAYPDIPVADYIAPRSLDFSHPDYYICDGMYTAVLLIKSNGYPTAVYAGWMSSLIEGGDGVDVDVILRKENRASAKEKVALKMKLNRIKASGRSDIDMDYEELHNAIESAAYIKNCLSSGEDLYQMYTFITVSSETLMGLNLQLEHVQDSLYSRDIEVRRIKWRLKEAFQIVCPVLNYKKSLFDLAMRNVMTSGAASTYMMTSAEICDDYGIVMGVNNRYQSLVNMDIFNTKKYKNANITIVGTSGAGKTYTELLMALRMRMQGIQVFIISPDKAHEFRRASVHIGGSYIRISTGSNDCINIMDIRPEVNPIAEFLDEQEVEDSWLAKKVTQLLTFFHLLIADLTNEEEQLVDEAIIKTYARYGITQQNDSIFNPDGSVKEMPIIGDLHTTLAERQETKRIANILARFVTGSAQSFNRRTNVNLNNKFIVFDLQELSGTLKAIGMFIVMDFIWARTKEDRTERKAIFIDEAWQLIGASTDKSVADFVHRIFKIIRGYGGSAILATQDVSDLFAYQDGKFGKAILSNSKTKIILQLEQVEAEALSNSLELTKQEIREIINFERGQALICANNNKVPISIRASRREHELITTDPAELRRLVANKKRSMSTGQAAAQQPVQAQPVQTAPAAPVQPVNIQKPAPAQPQAREDIPAPSGDYEPATDTGEDLARERREREQIRQQQKLDAMMTADAMDQLRSIQPSGAVENEQVPFVPTDDSEPPREPDEPADIYYAQPSQIQQGRADAYTYEEEFQANLENAPEENYVYENTSTEADYDDSESPEETYSDAGYDGDGSEEQTEADAGYGGSEAETVQGYQGGAGASYDSGSAETGAWDSREYDEEASPELEQYGGEAYAPDSGMPADEDIEMYAGGQNAAQYGWGGDDAESPGDAGFDAQNFGGADGSYPDQQTGYPQQTADGYAPAYSADFESQTAYDGSGSSMQTDEYDAYEAAEQPHENTADSPESPAAAQPEDSVNSSAFSQDSADSSTGRTAPEKQPAVKKTVRRISQEETDGSSPAPAAEKRSRRSPAADSGAANDAEPAAKKSSGRSRAASGAAGSGGAGGAASGQKGKKQKQENGSRASGSSSKKQQLPSSDSLDLLFNTPAPSQKQSGRRRKNKNASRPDF